MKRAQAPPSLCSRCQSCCVLHSMSSLCNVYTLSSFFCCHKLATEKKCGCKLVAVIVIVAVVALQLRRRVQFWIFANDTQKSSSGSRYRPQGTVKWKEFFEPSMVLAKPWKSLSSRAPPARRWPIMLNHFAAAFGKANTFCTWFFFIIGVKGIIFGFKTWRRFHLR